jgi:hypothetical protein
MAESSDFSDDSSACYSVRSSLPVERARRKSQVLEDIIDKLRPVTNVSYTPFKYESRQLAKALLLASFPSNLCPFDYFSLFFTPELFRTITKNTNRYASIYKIRVLQEKAREWSDLLLEELYVFVSVIIYISIHYKPKIKLYWNLDFNKGPLHLISSYISLHRFQQIKRYYYISCSKSDEQKGYHLPANKIW